MGVDVEEAQPPQSRLSNESQCSSSQHCQRSEYSSVDHDVDELYTPCRVCHCVESEKWADSALAYLNIIPPSSDHELRDEQDVEPGSIEFVGPDGKIFVCSADIESGSCWKDSLLDLGCSCKNELARAHYACALKWFISRGSPVCEICGGPAKNVKPEDLKKIITCLRDYELLNQRTMNGIVDSPQVGADSGLDPDAVAAVRRQRLSEISSWFGPQSSVTPVSDEVVGQPAANPAAEVAPESQSAATKWVVEATGILVAAGLLTVIVVWLIAPRVGKKTAKDVLHILLGGMVALAAVIFLRFVVLTRVKYGPLSYWAILFAFWFVVFGVWAGRTHGIRSS